jgi:hypothetical protein
VLSSRHDDAISNVMPGKICDALGAVDKAFEITNTSVPCSMRNTCSSTAELLSTGQTHILKLSSIHKLLTTPCKQRAVHQNGTEGAEDRTCASAERVQTIEQYSQCSCNA